MQRMIIALIVISLVLLGCSKKTELWKFDAGETAKFQTNPVYSKTLNAVIFWSSYSTKDPDKNDRYVIPKTKSPGNGIQMELDKKIYKAVLRSVDVATGKLLWTSPDIGESDQNISSPVLFEGQVYVGSDNGNLYALNEKDGAIAWSFNTGSWVYSTPFVNTEYITCANENGELYVFNRIQQRLMWKKLVGETEKTWPIVDGIVYGVVGNMIKAYEVKTGKELPGISVGDKYYDFNGLEQKGAPIISELIVNNGFAYFTAASNFIYKVDLKERTLSWQSQIGEVGQSSPVITNGSVFIGTRTRDVLQLNDTDGSLVRQYKTDNRWLDYSLKMHKGGPVNGTVSVDNGVVYFGSYDYGFYAHDIKTGKRIWKYAIKHHIDRTKPIITDTLVIFGADSHHLYALER